MPPVTPMTPTRETAPFASMRVPFCEIHEPGAYVSNSTGHLVRIPADAVKADRSPVIDLVADEPQLFSKISHNAFVSLTKARILAADLDLPVNF